MSITEVTSHFWVARPPFFSSTLLLACEEGEGRVTTTLTLFDVEGVQVNEVEVEFPAGEVGIVELEPFSAALKTQGGVAHGHLAVSSPVGTRHLCRQSIGGSTAMMQDPIMIKGRESSFIPLIIGAQREHQVVLVNASPEAAQVLVRLFYANRAPEWTVNIPANASKLISLEQELLNTSEDTSWEKGALQAYMRVAVRQQATVSCHIIERIPGESAEQDAFRCLASW